MAEPPDLDTLARRYLDLWQEQVAAAAADPELTQTYARMAQAMSSMSAASWMALWSGAMSGFDPSKPGPQKAHDASATATPTAASAASRAPAAAAAPGHGGDDMAELGRRLAALEERLGRIESRLGPVPGLGAGPEAAGAGPGRRVRRSGS